MHQACTPHGSSVQAAARRTLPSCMFLTAVCVLAPAAVAVVGVRWQDRHGHSLEAERILLLHHQKAGQQPAGPARDGVRGPVHPVHATRPLQERLRRPQPPHQAAALHLQQRAYQDLHQEDRRCQRCMAGHLSHPHREGEPDHQRSQGVAHLRAQSVRDTPPQPAWCMGGTWRVHAGYMQVARRVHGGCMGGAWWVHGSQPAQLLCWLVFCLCILRVQTC